MAMRRKKSRPAPNLREHPMVKKLIASPANPPDLVAVWGLPGKSDRPGTWRFYVSADLGAYIEIPDREILHVLPLAPGGQSLEGTIVWVRRAAMAGMRIVGLGEASAEGRTIAELLESAEPRRAFAPAGFIMGPIAKLPPVTGIWPFCVLSRLSDSWDRLAAAAGDDRK